MKKVKVKVLGTEYGIEWIRDNRRNEKLIEFVERAHTVKSKERFPEDNQTEWNRYLEAVIVEFKEYCLANDIIKRSEFFETLEDWWHEIAFVCIYEVEIGRPYRIFYYEGNFSATVDYQDEIEWLIEE